MSFRVTFTLFFSPQIEPCHYFGAILVLVACNLIIYPVFFDFVFIDATPVFYTPVSFSLPPHLFTLSVTDVHSFGKFVTC